MKKQYLPYALLLTSALWLTACGADSTSPDTANAETSESADTGLEAYLLSEAPEGAIPVGEALASAQPGEKIVVSGQIGAAMKPFSATFASFVLGDQAIKFCDEIEDDHCPTPWDACCEDPELVSNNRASVQLLADNAPVRGSLKGVGGLQELDHVVVEGEVDPSSTPENLIINATGIYRQSN